MSKTNKARWVRLSINVAVAVLMLVIIALKDVAAQEADCNGSLCYIGVQVLDEAACVDLLEHSTGDRLRRHRVVGPGSFLLSWQRPGFFQTISAVSWLNDCGTGPPSPVSNTATADPGSAPSPVILFSPGA